MLICLYVLPKSMPRYAISTNSEYYLDDLEQTDCQAENIKNRKALNESSVSILFHLIS
jgi:hypothetical protein